MKKITLLMAMLMILLASTAIAEGVVYITPAPAAQPELTLLPSDDEVKVYAIPSTKSNIVGYIIVGGRQEVIVEAVQGDWVKVQFTSIRGMTEGWIPRACFAAAATPTPTPTPAPTLSGSAFIRNPQSGFRLNLRTGPSSSYTSLGKYYTGTPVTLMGESRGGYLRVRIGSVTGWVDARFITDDGWSFTSELPHVTITNPGGGANLRDGASTSAMRIGWYPHGASVTILGVREDEWYHVAVAGQTGYMSSTLLSRTFPWHMGADSDAPAISGSTSASGANMFTTTATHLRASASASARSLGVFYSGCPVSVISYTRTGWAYVRIGELSGYVDTGSLSATAPIRTGQTRTIINPYGTGLNLRTMPTTDSTVLFLCRNYASVCVLGDLADDWCYVVVDGQAGYMMGTRLVP